MTMAAQINIAPAAITRGSTDARVPIDAAEAASAEARPYAPAWFEVRLLAWEAQFGVVRFADLTN
jgi:hypothetical protein